MRLSPTVDLILDSTQLIAAIPIVSDAVVYTHSFKFGSSEYFSLAYKAGSAGTVELKIELEQSNVLPATEGASDTSFVVAENGSDIESALGDKVQHYKKISPVVTIYGRLKITGGATNAATTTLTSSFAKQEEV